MMARHVFLTSWPRTPCLSTCNIMFRTRKTGWFLSHFFFCNLLKYFWSLPARGPDNHGCRNLPRGPCLRWPKKWISNQLLKQIFVQLQLLSGHPTSSSLWSLFLEWFNYVYADIVFIQSSTLFRFCRENNVWGFHLLFPFSCWPNSKAMMSEEERGGNIDRYIFIYLYQDGSCASDE